MSRCKARTNAGTRCKKGAGDNGLCGTHRQWQNGKAKIGRPSKLTPAIQETICTALHAGNYAAVAAQYAGICPSTFYLWMQRGKEDREAGRETIYSEFMGVIKKAETDAEVRAVAHIQKAMPHNWQAAMTYLERKHPKRWSRGERVELTGKDGAPLLTKIEVEFVEADGGDSA